MSTHATVIVRCKDKVYRSVRVHHDGYPSHMVVLNKCCPDQKSAELLIAKGDVDSLGESLTEGYNKTCSTFIEPHVSAIEYTSLNDYFEKTWRDHTRYVYLFDREWYLVDGGLFPLKSFVPLNKQP